MHHKHATDEFKAPELNVPIWISSSGKLLGKPVFLSDYKDKFIVLFCFQSWCPGCHSYGLPALKQMTEALKENVIFLAIQTVFEGKEVNTFERLVETQKKYALAIPFGQDEGDATSNYMSATMYDYQTGGTSWFVLIDRDRNVIFSDFRLDTAKTIAFLTEIRA